MTNTTNKAIADAVARRLADMRDNPVIMPDKPARKLPPRSRRHSVRHRAIR